MYKTSYEISVFQGVFKNIISNLPVEQSDWIYLNPCTDITAGTNASTKQNREQCPASPNASGGGLQSPERQ